jgi:hypothetical protein
MRNMESGILKLKQFILFSGFKTLEILSIFINSGYLIAPKLSYFLFLIPYFVLASEPVQENL